jgi:protein SCO1/2
MLRAFWFAGVIGLVSLPASAGDPAPATNADRELDAAALRASQAAIGRVLGDHGFTDQHGRPLHLAQLRGRPLVLSLIYTNCYYICSGLTLHLRDAVRMAQETLGAGRFAVLTVGFDAQHDTPERMLAYRRDRGIDVADWRFASADAATIGRLADETGFTWAASPRGFEHIAQVTILDADGRVVQQVYGQDFSPPQLVEPLKSLVLARGLDRSTVRGILDTVQLYCTTYDPVSGRYGYDFSMLVSALPALLVLGMVAIAILVAGRRQR